MCKLMLRSIKKSRYTDILTHSHRMMITINNLQHYLTHSSVSTAVQCSIGTGTALVIWRGVLLYAIYGMRGAVQWLIKYEAKPSALSSMRPQSECYKSRKARHDNIKWFKVFAVVAVPTCRFTKLSSSMRSPRHSAISHHWSSLVPVQQCPKVFFWQREKSRLVLRAELKQRSDQVLRVRALWP